MLDINLQVSLILIFIGIGLFIKDSWRKIWKAARAGKG